MVSVYPERAPDRHGLISIELIEEAPNVLPPGPNYVFRRIGGLSLFIPNISIDAVNVGALAEPPPPPLRPPQQPPPPPPPLEVPQLQRPSTERLTLFSWRLLEILNGGPEMRDNHYGRFVSLFWGRVIWGVNRMGWFTATLYMYFSFLINTQAMEEIFTKHFGELTGITIRFIGGCLGFLTVGTFLIFGLSDPGVVPKNYTLRELLAETEEYRARHPGERYYSYCSDCRTCRPPRTFHCATCDICIRGHDGHLKVTGTCVGERNRRSYFFHVIFQTLWGTLMLVTILLITIDIIKGSTANTRKIIIHLVVSWVGGIVLLFILYHGSIFKLISKMYLICLGRTSTEEYRRRHGLDTNDCFVERLSVAGNVRNFFCRKSMPSAFAKMRKAFIGYGYDDISDAWILEQWPRERPTVEMQELMDFIQTQMEDTAILEV